jgi:mannose-1-phosphate guanylyltransferase
MEKVPDLTRLVPASFEWSDIGNWRAIERFLTKDSHCNASKGSFVSVDSKNNIIYAEPGKLVALADVSDMIVVATHDAVLIIPKSSDQKIKAIYEKLPSEFR